MKILIDIGHPAHVHYFRNFIKIMESKGHEIRITARDKDVTVKLLNFYNLPFFNRGKGSKTAVGKILYIIKADWKIYKFSKHIKPDVFLSFGSPYASHVAKVMGKPHVAFTDTEAANLTMLFYKPFTELIATPEVFTKNLGVKQIRFKGIMDLAYLHPNYFHANTSIREYLGLDINTPYFVLRFVAWEASHDIGEGGMSDIGKLHLIESLSKYGRVFITSENKLSDDLSKYQLKIQPEQMHDVLASSDLYFGESPTMATESAICGVPAVLVSSWADEAGVVKQLVSEKMVLSYKPEKEKEAINKAIEIVTSDKSKNDWIKRKDEFIKKNIDLTAFMVWLIENYPKSKEIIIKDPNYQQKFFG
ncbi:DUF354 domain-containing protein [Lentimicrobium sp. S6]|uniref:DUF354 domain-containing protein n=1 Tax=Lentimicrobium sp. S6 TaxID=2735872 RepID=UPI0015566479|nr:DUF354 domain-containing protein [Lentimicrobium sp. S6]NPD46726.1 DUF354 domain-containing protein [Lentimicrobium sp. S6]